MVVPSIARPFASAIWPLIVEGAAVGAKLLKVHCENWLTLLFSSQLLVASAVFDAVTCTGCQPVPLNRLRFKALSGVFPFNSVSR